MNNKTKIGLAVLALTISFGVGRFSKPAKVEIQTKEVVKTVTVKEEAKTKIVYKNRIVYPDGTIKETETSREDTHSNTETNTDIKKEASSVTTRDSDLTLQALAIVDIDNVAGKREYGLYAKKRMFGNVSIGVLVTTDKKVGAGIGYEF